MNEEQIRELLREMRDEPVPADSLARVRMGVEARVQSQASRGWWKPAAAGAVAAVIGIAVWLHKPAPVAEPLRASVAPVAPVVQQEPQAARPPAPQEPQEPSEPSAQRASRTRHAARTIPVREVGGKGTVIRIETPDPDVVIVLLGD